MRETALIQTKALPQEQKRTTERIQNCRQSHNNRSMDAPPPWHLSQILPYIAAVFFASSLAGLAALLRSGRKLGWRPVVSSLLNSGILGAGVFLVWWNLGGDENLVLAAGVCALAGLGGTNTVEFVAELVRQVARKVADSGNDGKDK